MSLSKTLIKNAFSNYAGFAISALVSIFVSPFVVHHLGNTGYGLWALFQSVFGYFGLLDMGLGVSVIKYISQFKARDDRQSINTFGSTIFFTYTIIGGVALVLSLGLAPIITHVFSIPSAYKHIAFYAVIISGFTTAVVFPMGFLANSLSAHQRYDLSNAIGIIRSILYAASIVFLLKHGFGLLSLFMLNLVLSVITTLIAAYLVLVKYKFILIKLRLFSLDMLKTAYKYSIFVFLNSLSAQVLLNIGNMIISILLTVELVTFYALATKIGNVILQTVSAIVAITLPVFSSLWDVNDKEKLRFTYLEITKGIMLLSLPVSMVAIIFSESILNVWIGPGYHLAALTLIFIVGIFFIHYIGGYITGILLFGIGRHKALSIANAIAAAVNLPLAIGLTKLIEMKFGHGYGIFGIPIALGLSMNAVDIFFLPWYVNKIIELPNRQYLKTFVKPVLFIVPAIVVALLIKHYYEPHKLIVFVLESAIIGLFYWGLYYLFGMTKDERARYLGYVSQFVGKS
ncbi:MAG: oligosaccharide flippase family protein [Deltaproteobacteria bacterium]|nr:oligosaccharide flippase family protein [Deltaproteobacteria bacterium]MCL5791443.1 oligosaccharide flippase family protein [Deltaproteobacteria bacterium]